MMLTHQHISRVFELPAPDQVLVGQIEIGGQSGGHEGMNPGLEFE